MSLAAALLAILLAQDTLEKDIDALIARMKESLAARTEATASLLELRRRDPRAIRIMRLRAEAEKDVRVRTRLDYLAGSRLMTWSWSTVVPEAVQGLVAAGPDGLLIQKADRTVSFYAAKDGARRWQLKEDVAWARAPEIAGAHAYIVVNTPKVSTVRILSLADGRMRRISVLNAASPTSLVAGDVAAESLASGRIRVHPANLEAEGWEKQLPVTVRLGLTPSAAVLYDGVTSLAALDAGTGKKLWVAQTDFGIEWMGGTASHVIIRHTRNKLQAYDAATGKELWREAIPGESGARPAPILTDKYCMSITPNLSCRNIATGAELWSLETRGTDKAAIEGMHVSGNALVYLQGGTLSVIRLSNGRTEYVELPDMPRIVKLVGGGNQVYLVTESGAVVAHQLDVE